MGRVYTFNCPRCEYRARVSGGREEGFHCVTETIECRDCRALHDVAVRVRVAEATRVKAGLMSSPKDLLPPMLLFGGPQRNLWQEFPPHCPVNARHRVDKWRMPGKCPRCGMFLERDTLPYRIWD